MSYRNINILTGWATFAIALTVYLLTLEPTVSFWDCGEFLACAYKLEVGHSPGAPFFMLLQRMFGILAGGQADKVAMFINAESALASAFTILFLFWTITHMARKLVTGTCEYPTGSQTLLIMGSGVVGALAYTFSDTFWFSAVEAEVYATSSFFTALVFWAILKWENVADTRYADRWLVLIAYLIGISIGVHLLNLLAIPALAMVYYFKRHTVSKRGMIGAFVAGIILLAFVQFGIIQYLPIIASKFELLFVNDFGLPFDSGAIFFMCLFIAFLIWFLLYARKKNWYLVHTGILCVMFIIIGFSSYLVPIIRSRADTPVDMTNPDNVMSLVGYVQRSQYLQQPIVYGPDYNSQITGMDKTAKVYGRARTGNKDAYEHIDDRIGYKYEEGSKRFFPRIWDHDAAHAQYYRNYMGLDEGEEPTAADNLSFFLGYQFNWMWWRYFMWNYAGRQNDQQGLGGIKSGNWISGIKAIDKMRVGDMDKMSEAYAKNGARNQLYLLPLILGILGMVYQFNNHKRDAIVTTMLFFFTGIAIALYLNMNPMQPRERDYAFAGSTYAFAIWIGLGVLMVQQWMQKAIKGSVSIPATIVLCLLVVPVLMASEEWDDHDRSKSTLAHASAYNTLISCAPDAILFTNGDNDTYPLWYLQEVEGVRKDVRVIITELLGTDWYIDQLNYRINDAAAVPMLWKYDDYKGNRHNYVPFYNSPQIPQDKYYNLAELCAFINSSDPKNQVQNAGGESMNFLPSKNAFLVAPTSAEIVGNGWVKATDSAFISNEVKFTLPDKPLYKNDLALLNIIAAIANDGWKRPIYFNGSFPGNSNMLNLGRYMHMEGINYRLLPFTYKGLPEKVGLDSGPIDVEKTFDLIMNGYKWGGAERGDVHFDDKYKVMLISYRLIATRLAEHLAANNRKADAVKILDKITHSLTEYSFPYDMTACYIAMAYYHAGDIPKAREIAIKVAKNAEDDLAWINTLSDEQQATVTGDIQNDLTALNLLSRAAKESGDAKTGELLEGKLQAHYNKMLPILEAGRTL